MQVFRTSKEGFCDTHSVVRALSVTQKVFVRVAHTQLVAFKEIGGVLGAAFA